MSGLDSLRAPAGALERPQFRYVVECCSKPKGTSLVLAQTGRWRIAYFGDLEKFLRSCCASDGRFGLLLRTPQEQLPEFVEYGVAKKDA